MNKIKFVSHESICGWGTFVCQPHPCSHISSSAQIFLRNEMQGAHTQSLVENGNFPSRAASPLGRPASCWSTSGNCTQEQRECIEPAWAEPEVQARATVPGRPAPSRPAGPTLSPTTTTFFVTKVCEFLSPVICDFRPIWKQILMEIKSHEIWNPFTCWSKFAYVLFPIWVLHVLELIFRSPNLMLIDFHDMMTWLCFFPRNQCIGELYIYEAPFTLLNKNTYPKPYIVINLYKAILYILSLINQSCLYTLYSLLLWSITYTSIE